MNWLYARLVARAVRQLRPAVIEVHNRPPLATYLARRFANTPVILVLHNDPHQARGADSAEKRKQLLQRLDAVVLVSNWLRQRFLAGVSRPTNHAGGLEGGVTNGEDVRVSAWMKPISTLMKPLRSVDLTTMNEAAAAIERSDVCAVPAAAVVGEAMVALVLADAVTEKFGGDSVAELERAISGWNSTVREQFAAKQP